MLSDLLRCHFWEGPEAEINAPGLGGGGGAKVAKDGVCRLFPNFTCQTSTSSVDAFVNVCESTLKQLLREGYPGMPALGREVAFGLWSMSGFMGGSRCS